VACILASGLDLDKDSEMWQDNPHQGMLANGIGWWPERHTQCASGVPKKAIWARTAPMTKGLCTFETYGLRAHTVKIRSQPVRCILAMKLHKALQYSRCVRTHAALQLTCSFAHGKPKKLAVETADTPDSCQFTCSFNALVSTQQGSIRKELIITCVC